MMADVFPSGVYQSEPSKHVALLGTIIEEHDICVQPFVFHLLSPSTPVALEDTGAHKGRHFSHVPTGRLLLPPQPAC